MGSSFTCQSLSRFLCLLFWSNISKTKHLLNYQPFDSWIITLYSSYQSDYNKICCPVYCSHNVNRIRVILCKKWTNKNVHCPRTDLYFDLDYEISVWHFLCYGFCIVFGWASRQTGQQWNFILRIILKVKTKDKCYSL